LTDARERRRIIDVVGPAAAIWRRFSLGISWLYQDIDSTSTNKNTNKVAERKKIGPLAFSHQARFGRLSRPIES
jgi:hypothetical protein